MSSTLISTRRSRRLSRHSLRKTTQAACSLMAPPASRERLEPLRADELHEGLLQACFTGQLAQRIGAALRDDAAARNDDDVIAQRCDLLHDVRGKQHTAALAAQAAQELAQAARGHDVQ